VEIIKKSELSCLIDFTNSCSHTRSSDISQTHCGVCSQCIERRLATLLNELEDDDPDHRYKTRLFLDPLEKADDKTMVESYIRHARLLENIPDNEFFQKFPEAHRALGYVNFRTSEAARRVFDLHRRHGQQVGSVVSRQIRNNADDIRKGRIQSHSLLAILIKQPRKSNLSLEQRQTFSTPENTKWEDISIEIVSNDSARIRIGEIVKIYTAYDMGFCDGRMGNMLNKQWDLLVSLAKGEGILSWESGNSGFVIYKKIQRLKDILKKFFQLKESPIKTYQKKSGYITRFKIANKKYGQ